MGCYLALGLLLPGKRSNHSAPVHSTLEKAKLTCSSEYKSSTLVYSRKGAFGNSCPDPGKQPHVTFLTPHQGTH